MPLEEFLSRVAQETGVPGGPSRVELLSGFPPAPLPLPEVGHGRTLASLGLASGDALVARQGAPSTAEVANAEAEAAEAAEAAAARAAAASSAAAASPLSGPDHHPSSAAAAAADWSSLVGGDDLLDEDAALAAAIAASLQDSEGGVGGERGNGGAATAPSTAPLASFPIPAAAAAAPPPRRANNDGPNFGDMRSLIASGASTNDRGNAGSINQGSIPTVSLRDGSAVARRVVDADNSCLFASVGYVMEGTRSAASKLRAVVAKAVVSDRETYNEAFLGGKSPEEYAAWILDSQNWGGGIELSIFAKHYGVELAAHDIATGRVDLYGQNSGATRVAMLVYDGLHYDAMALAKSPFAPEEADVTTFRIADPRTDDVRRAAKELVARARAARQFTDTAKFTLRCGVCGSGLKGEKEALEHARETGHQNFQEY